MTKASRFLRKISFFGQKTPQGVRVRVSSTENTPKGDTKFWQEALFFHLSPYYAEAQKISFQNKTIAGVLLTSKDAEPFLYLTAQIADDERLVVFEAFFPDSLVYESVKDQVFAAFDGVVLP